MERYPSSSLPPACSRCGLTIEALRETGLMGCSYCYRAFAPLVAHAIHALHGGTNGDGAQNTAPASPPPPVELPPDRGRLPWPTKRAASR